MIVNVKIKTTDILPMKRSFFLLCILLTFVMMGVSSEETVHMLKKGETIYSIARLYGVDVQTILKINNITDPTKLPAGREIRIPTESDADSALQSQNFSSHKVVKGETLYGIARYYEISLDLLRSANNLANDFLLKEGYVLKIPLGEAVVKTSPVQPELPLIPVSVTDMNEPRTVIVKNIDNSITWPVSVKEMAYMTGKLDGIMLLGEKSEAVKSLTQGTVVSAGPYRGFGKVVIVQRTGGYIYVYGGCESLNVKQGDRVAPGTELGRLGIDPVSIKPQLFLLVRQNNVPLDPAKAPRN
jgi:murein DD-endopeptidase MepM/ murein hydrolase activator NlpD